MTSAPIPTDPSVPQPASAPTAPPVASAPPVTWTAPLGARVHGVRRLAVLRGGRLGDLVQTLPALAALRAAYPDAELVLLGAPLAPAVLDGRGLVDRIEVLPVAPGLREGPDDAHDPAAVEEFVDRVAAPGVDLAVQLHGGGRNSNPFLLRLGARCTAGLATPDAAPLDRTLPYEYYQHEVLRGLEVAALAGAPAVHLEPSLPVLPHERDTGRAALGRADGAPVVVLHPGASDPRRHWPVERWAALAAGLAADARVVLVGDGDDVERADRIRSLVPDASADRVGTLAGRLDLPALIGVLAAADVVVANDSGPRHLAQAVGTSTVGIFWIGNAYNAAPFGRARHRIRLGWTTACPVCGADLTQVGWTAPRCPHDISVVDGVGVDEVLADARALLGAG